MRASLGFLAFLTTLGLIAAARPAAAQTETLTVPFNLSTGTTTSNIFSGTVHIHVSGTGNALFNDTSDAFYFTATQAETSPSNGDFELAIGTPQHPFVGEGDGQGGKTDAIKYNIVAIDGIGAVSPGTIPAYSATNTYDFTITVPNTTPTALTFGVNDGGLRRQHGVVHPHGQPGARAIDGRRGNRRRPARFVCARPRGLPPSPDRVGLTPPARGASTGFAAA